MTDGVNGYVCEPRDADGFASGIRKIMEMTEAGRERMAERCIRSTQKFSKERTARRMHEIYREMSNIHGDEGEC